MLIVLLHTVRFQIPEIQLGQWHHHCLNVKCQPFSTDYLSLTVHYSPRSCHYTCLLEIRTSTSEGQVRSGRSPTPEGYGSGSREVHWGNRIYEVSLANIILCQVLDGWRSLETCHWCSGSSAGISRCSWRYTIRVSIPQQSISQNRSANTRSCKYWILFNARLSDFGYWLHPKIYIFNTDDNSDGRTVGRSGTSKSCQ